MPSWITKECSLPFRESVEDFLGSGLAAVINAASFAELLVMGLPEPRKVSE